MKMTQATNPLTGQKGNVLDIGYWWSSILGVVALIVIFATGQRLAGEVSNRVPVVDTKINRPFQDEDVKPKSTDSYI